MADIEVTLESAIDTIIDSIISTLQADDTLTDVKSIVKGNKFRSIPLDPFLAVHVLHVEATDKSMSLSQKWFGLFGVLCFAKLSTPENDYLKPLSLAARSMSALTTRPKLGNPTIIYNVAPDSIVPDDTKWSDLSRTSYTVCSAVVRIDFKTFEARRA